MIQYIGRLFGRRNNSSTIGLGNGRSVESITTYNVLSGIELIGSPVPVSYTEMARHSRNKRLPSLNQLIDANFYRRSFYGKTVQTASRVIGEDLGLADRIVSSPVNIRHVQDNVFIELYDFANYEQAVQFLRDNGNGKISVRSKQPFRYDESKGLIYTELADGVEGLAQVAIFSQPVDFRSYFSSPDEMDKFNEDYTVKGVAQWVFEEHFRKAVTEKAKEVMDLKKAKVKGVLLSPIKLKSRLADGIFVIARNPEGEFILGASYLV